MMAPSAVPIHMGTTASTMFAITTIGTGQSIRPQAVNSTVAVGEESPGIPTSRRRTMPRVGW